MGIVPLPTKASAASSRSRIAAISTIGQFRRHVLQAVDGGVYLAGQERLLQLLHEHAGARRSKGGRVADAVAGGRDHDRDSDDARVGLLQPGDDLLGLGQGEFAAAGTDPKGRTTHVVYKIKQTGMGVKEKQG
jgi:hypothetical protein